MFSEFWTLSLKSGQPRNTGSGKSPYVTCERVFAIEMAYCPQDSIRNDSHLPPISYFLTYTLLGSQLDEPTAKYTTIPSGSDSSQISTWNAIDRDSTYGDVQLETY